MKGEIKEAGQRTPVPRNPPMYTLDTHPPSGVDAEVEIGGDFTILTVIGRLQVRSNDRNTLRHTVPNIVVHFPVDSWGAILYP